jgi:pSer/pThr/pTyr-binding forkhead associated (FHA) protein
MLKLILKIAGVSVNEFDLDKNQITVGRDGNNDVVLDDPVVSSRHACIVTSTDANNRRSAWLEDLDSTNGTRVNGKEIRRAAVRHGDTIQIGRNTLHVFDDTAPAPTPSQS